MRLLGGRCPLWVISGLRPFDRDVRFTPESGHQADGLRCPLCARKRHMHRNKSHPH